jgi:hypothetical protein
MSIIILLESYSDGTGQKLHCCYDAKVEYSPRDGFDNGKMRQFEADLRDFVNRGLKNAKEGNDAK